MFNSISVIETKMGSHLGMGLLHIPVELVHCQDTCNYSTASWVCSRPLSLGNSGTLTLKMPKLMASLLIVPCNLINEDQRCGLLHFIALFVGISGDHL